MAYLTEVELPECPGVVAHPIDITIARASCRGQLTGNRTIWYRVLGAGFVVNRPFTA